MSRRRGVVRSDDEDAAPTPAPSRRPDAAHSRLSRPTKPQQRRAETDPAVLDLPNLAVLTAERAQAIREPDRLRERLAKAAENAMSIISDSAVAVEDVSDENSEQVAALETSLQETIDAQRHLQNVHEGIHHVSGILETGPAPETPHALHEIYINEVQGRDALNAGKSPAEKFGNVSEFLDFKRRVWDVKHANQPAPPSWFPATSNAEAEVVDDDLIIGQEIQSLKCPITLSLLENPVRNNNCPHVYSLDAIKELVRQGHGQCKCPVAGCMADVTLKSVREDKAMARRIELEKNRMEERMDEGPDDVHEITEGTSMIIEDLKVE